MCFALHLLGCCGCQANLPSDVQRLFVSQHKAISLFARYYTRINCLRREYVCALSFGGAAGIIIIKRLEN
jgi:hypothetical protein